MASFLLDMFSMMAPAMLALRPITRRKLKTELSYEMLKT